MYAYVVVSSSAYMWIETDKKETQSLSIATLSSNN